MKENNLLLPVVLITVLLCAIACNDNKKENNAPGKSKTDSAKTSEPIVESKKGPVINIGDTISIKRMVLVMKDSAMTTARVSMKLGEIYGSKLAAIIKKNNLKITGAPIAWYKAQKAPYFFEAGLPVDKKPATLPPGTYIKQIGADSIVVAHFYGPYDMLPQGYDALKEWLKDHKKKSKTGPYEIYIGDPVDSTGKLKDPYKVQTDVVWPWK
ncbi:MAG: GyrI-like domain-containing protein [Ferruginibacter sp.]